ncbi:MAG: peroxide stress protein YaaA [Flavobacteriales bacterium]
MLVIISPAKDLDMTLGAGAKSATQPELLEDSAVIMAKLRTRKPAQLAKLMDISPKLAQLNHERNQAWALPFTPQNSKPAILAFNGEVYRGLDTKSLSAGDMQFAQRHLRILSGLYGVLRPLDLMQAYRLEMGCGFTPKAGKKDLYAFWGDTITEALGRAMEQNGDNVLIDLASQEYAKAVRFAKLKARVITPVFKDKSPGGYRVFFLFARQQRGRMSRFIVQHRIMDPEALKRYDQDGYRYSAEMSTESEWTFIRDKRPVTTAPRARR